jgi:homospermidine synthase
MIGCGSIGLGVLPLLLRHIKFTQPNAVSIITGDDRRHVADTVRTKHNIPILYEYLTPANYEDILASFSLTKGDFIVNLSVDVSSLDIIKWCEDREVLYIDTVVEPWLGRYDNPDLSMSERTNYSLRQELLDYRDAKSDPQSLPTAITTHGANPGMVSHLAKQALLNIAAATSGGSHSPADNMTLDSNSFPVTFPSTQQQWGQLAMQLGLQVIHIAERDTQTTEQSVPPRTSEKPSGGTFINTWSVDGFLSEGCQPAEMGWGTHEKTLPEDGRRYSSGCQASIYLTRPGAGTRIRSWTPLGGPHVGHLITHNEAISMADYFSVKGAEERVVFRPTVLYAYRPCDSAMLALDELVAQNWDMDYFTDKRVVVDEVVAGRDELGVLLMGILPSTGIPYAYWYGSQLECATAKKLVEHNSATSLQVTSAVMAGVVWAMRNRTKGIVEPEQLPFDEILAIMTPYISPVVGQFTAWTPAVGRGILFPEDVDKEDPWQFKNFRVA